MGSTWRLVRPSRHPVQPLRHQVRHLVRHPCRWQGLVQWNPLLYNWVRTRPVSFKVQDRKLELSRLCSLLRGTAPCRTFPVCSIRHPCRSIRHLRHGTPAVRCPVCYHACYVYKHACYVSKACCTNGLLLDRGPKMETLPHPRDFMGPKWQDRVWSGDIKSGVCKMKCSALRFYATLSAKRSHMYMVGSDCGCLSVKQSFHQLYS